MSYIQVPLTEKRSMKTTRLTSSSHVSAGFQVSMANSAQGSRSLSESQ